MTTLFDSDLSCRDFGSHLLHTGELTKWAESKRLHLPDIAGFEFVQVEALLCRIERQDLTPEQAFEIVANDSTLKIHRAAGDPKMAKWLMGATAHKKWRGILSGAIENHELTLLEFASKLPISTAPVETVEQRRARYLAMFEAEEKREQWGALQRVADSEGVDRSNMKKDIDKARAARDKDKRAGVWTSQLVTRR